MKRPSSLRIEDTDAITSAIATSMSMRLCQFDERLDKAHLRHLAHQAIAARTDLTLLTARVADEVKAIIAGKLGVELANAVRLSSDALASPDGQRRWLQAAHRAALNAFHAIADDFRNGKASVFDLFLAQVALAGIAHARGLLGIPIEPFETRDMRNVRAFEPRDFPDPEVRNAIVQAVFNADEAGLALVRSRAGNPTDDSLGQITVLLEAIDSEDQHIRANLAALAGKIIDEARQGYAVEAVPDFVAMARQLRSTLRSTARQGWFAKPATEMPDGSGLSR